MMSIAIIVVIVIALAHFSYETVLAPTLRLRLRYRLFEQRDRLRELRYVHRDELKTEAFDYLHGALNTTLVLLSAISPSLLVAWEMRLRYDDELRAHVEKRGALLAACPIEEVRQIQTEVAGIARDAVLVNCAGMLLWLVPSVGLVFCLHRLARLLQKLILLPESELQRLLPARVDDPALA